MKNFLFLAATANLVNPGFLFCASIPTTSSVDPSDRSSVDDAHNIPREVRRRLEEYDRLSEKSPINDFIGNVTSSEITTRIVGGETLRTDDGRIIGGDLVKRGRYDYVAQFSKGLACGGLLIAPNIVLTAAHCEGGFKNVILGMYDYGNPKRAEKIPIIKEIIHPEFRREDFYADFMLLVLKRNSDFTPVCISKGIQHVRGDFLFVMGFGWLTSTGGLDGKMRRTKVKYMKNKACSKIYSKKLISDNMLCCDSSEKGRDACSGDSGGPLVRKNKNGQDVAVGVVSWGIGCATYPGVYGRISSAYNWINFHVRNNGHDGRGSLPLYCNEEATKENDEGTSGRANEETSGLFEMDEFVLIEDDQ